MYIGLQKVKYRFEDYKNCHIGLHTNIKSVRTVTTENKNHEMK